MNSIITMKNIVKSFPGVQALKSVSVDFYPGEIHALMGENGAGKSTLVKVLAGIYTADEGEIFLRGKKIKIESITDALKFKISMVHQELTPILDMDVAENIFLARENTKAFNLLDRKALYSRTKKLLNELDINIDCKIKMRNLSVAEIQLVEIAKAVSFESDILIMDEPTSAISEREVDKLFEILRALRKRGTSIIYISHKMDEIFQISDRITVMRDGEHICTKLSSELNNETLIKYMVGRELTEQFPKKTAAIKDAIMEVEHFSDGHYFEDINFKVRRGEVLGIAGLMGAGRTELVEAIFGMRKTNSGNLKICGEEVKIRSPREAIMNKIALVPEDRKIVGLNLLFSIMGNITLPTLSKFCACGIISKRKEREIADDYIKLLRIATPTRNKPVVELSGGNQEKVVIAKWLLTNADIVIMDEPTRGIDVGAKAEIYEIINKLVAEGKAVIMISSEMPEVIGMSDRILVMSEGKITGELTRNEFSQEKIMGLASIV